MLRLLTARSQRSMNEAPFDEQIATPVRASSWALVYGIPKWFHALERQCIQSSAQTCAFNFLASILFESLLAITYPKHNKENVRELEANNGFFIWLPNETKYIAFICYCLRRIKTTVSVWDVESSIEIRSYGHNEFF